VFVNGNASFEANSSLIMTGFKSAAKLSTRSIMDSNESEQNDVIEGQAYLLIEGGSFSDINSFCICDMILSNSNLLV